jgi:hypothetical protein
VIVEMLEMWCNRCWDTTRLPWTSQRREIAPGATRGGPEAYEDQRWQNTYTTIEDGQNDINSVQCYYSTTGSLHFGRSIFLTSVLVLSFGGRRLGNAASIPCSVTR